MMIPPQTDHVVLALSLGQNSHDMGGKRGVWP